MLNNRILVVGLDRNYLDILAKIKSEFLFISIPSLKNYDETIHSLEGLIFNGDQMSDIARILPHFDKKPIFGIGKGPLLESVRWVAPPPNPLELEKTLNDLLGDLRAPPNHTGLLGVGTVVKNKIFSTWGLGVIKQKLEDDLYVVNFPQVAKVMKKEDQVCHKSVLRMICTLKEITK